MKDFQKTTGVRYVKSNVCPSINYHGPSVYVIQ